MFLSVSLATNGGKRDTELMVLARSGMATPSCIAAFCGICPAHFRVALGVRRPTLGFTYRACGSFSSSAREEVVHCSRRRLSRRASLHRCHCPLALLFSKFPALTFATLRCIPTTLVSAQSFSLHLGRKHPPAAGLSAARGGTRTRSHIRNERLKL